MSDDRKNDWSSFKLPDVIVAVTAILFVLYLLLPGPGGHGPSYRNVCSNNLKQLVLACHGFHDVNQRLPAARWDERFLPSPQILSGTDPSDFSALGPNWIVATSPYFEASALYDAFAVNLNGEMAAGIGKPLPGEKSPYMWNIDAALTDGTLVRSASLSLFQCPADKGHDVHYAGLGGQWARTNYAINAGPCEMMIGPNKSPCLLNGASPPFGLTAAGVSQVNWGYRLNALTAADGTANTVMIAEILVGVSPEDIRGTWALGYPGASVLANAGVPNASDPNHPRADRIPDCLKVQTAVGGEAKLAKPRMGCDPSAKGAEQTAARSRHPRGINVAFCDGSVQFIVNEISSRMWYRMLSARDGEQVSFMNE